MTQQAKRTWTDEDRRREVEGWKASGQTRAVYAATRGYSQGSLSAWASALKRATPVPEPRVVRLEIEKRRPEVVIEIGPARVCVTAGFDATLLCEVIAAIGVTNK